jgi:hypothetical protein
MELDGPQSVGLQPRREGMPQRSVYMAPCAIGNFVAFIYANLS